MITIRLEAEFEIWKKSFLSSFEDAGWSKIREAYTFRHIGGSFVDYALRKEHLLVNIKKDFPTDILIHLIAVGLPVYIQEKIDRSKITSTEVMFTELRKLDGQTYKKKTKFNLPTDDAKNENQRPTNRQNDYKPFSYCEKQGYPNRYHPVEKCRLKQKNEKIKSENIKELIIPKSKKF